MRPSPAAGFSSAESLARSVGEALSSGKREESMRLFPSAERLRAMCVTDPARLIATIHDYRDKEIVAGFAQMAALDIRLVSVDVPAVGDVDRRALGVGATWKGSWDDDARDAAGDTPADEVEDVCALARPIEVVGVALTVETVSAGKPDTNTLRFTFLHDGDQWFLVSDSAVPEEDDEPADPDEAALRQSMGKCIAMMKHTGKLQGDDDDTATKHNNLTRTICGRISHARYRCETAATTNAQLEACMRSPTPAECEAGLGRKFALTGDKRYGPDNDLRARRLKQCGDNLMATEVECTIAATTDAELEWCTTSFYR